MWRLTQGYLRRLRGDDQGEIRERTESHTLSDTRPFASDPQHLTFSSTSEMAQHVSHAQLKCMSDRAVASLLDGMPLSWPLTVWPQQRTSPARLIAHLVDTETDRQSRSEKLQERLGAGSSFKSAIGYVCRLPALTKSVWPRPGGTLDCPSELLPQHTTLSSSRMAHVCKSPHAIILYGPLWAAASGTLS